MKKNEKLLGDMISNGLHKIGANKVSSIIESVTKRPCNCGKRKQALNNFHEKFKK